MAEANLSVSQDQFICSICLDLLKDPVTIPCGHSYCMSCITKCWDQDDQRGVYSCPQCRQIFTTRPALGKNTMLAEVVEKLKKSKLHTNRSDLSYAGPEDVECDVCTGRKYKAIKSCLVCLESYCQTHFEQHEAFRTGKRHKVIDVTGRLQEMICSQHDRLFEVYCRTDQRCICLLCTMDEHKNHDNVSAAAERTEKQRLLEDNQGKLHQIIQQKEKELQDLREAVKIHTISAQTTVKDTERIFTELIRSIKRRRSEVIQLIRDQEKTAVSGAEELLKKLKREIDDLRRRNDKMEKLSQTKDHISFLQSFQSLSSSPGSKDNIIFSSLLSFDDVRKSVTQLKEQMEDFCEEEIEKISSKEKCQRKAFSWSSTSFYLVYER
ncbi:E3 ubiquitin/ISG15 ligase TRIM25-like isoform X2 [Paramisgurnus dabryanus]|uniref:E3 ubiquitin/ISG15 ligase TRIM25-like isoform X2 n=1 Tax=Paramisgurnus dabryanus TaxID=90735 RepID=UPI0031F42A42